MYPNLKLCAPVTYDADARHVFGLSQSCAQFAERYAKFATAPLSAACSVMRASPRVGLPGASNGPHAARYEPRPASRRSRLVTGELHVNWLFLISVPPRYCVVSGDVVAVRPPRPIAPTTSLAFFCTRQASPELPNAAPLQGN